MKNFLTVLIFELNNYFKNKGYAITTVLISVLLIIGLSLPSFIDLSGLIPPLAKESITEGGDISTEENTKQEDPVKYAIVDSQKIISNYDELSTVFPDSTWEVLNSKEEAEKLINEGSIEGAFVVDGLNKYTYLVMNTGFHDSNQYIFNEYLANLDRKAYADKHGLDLAELQAIVQPAIESDITILGKDGTSNYFYVYMLLFATYMMILLYGQLIATSVTAEKSNRAIEVLVTSTNSNSLIFGKVIGAALASFIQVAAILGSGMIAYSINRNAWNGLLDGIFNIPSNILIAFIMFGGVGYIFYSFIFGALGALVSKTEDISSSVSSITMIFVIVFLISMFGLNNSDSMLIKVSSFIPFSSCMTMLIRVAMGAVSNLEILISFIILVGSTILVALGAAKIYRLATLMYGNPIKLKNTLKWFKKEK